MTQQQTIPDELLGPLVDATASLGEPARLRRSFADEGYVFLRGVLDRGNVLAARCEVFARLAEMEEILPPVEAAIASGTSRRRELAPDLGAFWKSVSEGPHLRRVTHSSRLRELAALILDAPARPHDYLFLRPAPVGNATNLHYDFPFFAGGASQIVTCWAPLGEIPICDGPLAVIERSNHFDDLIEPIRSIKLTGDPQAFAAAQEAAYQSSATDTLAFARSRKARILTAHFQPGDIVIFGGFTMHGSLDNHSPLGRVRLSVDVRYQPAADRADDPRFFGPHPIGAKGGSYGEQKAAQPLGTPWAARQ
ncbi:MAG TPA: phytanoyl-CoA dioxygenase family protein [Planctomycetaceae bacterium]|nr:phytanoyl-CoA dioxygenase family protein [Planctomycetaceae bacterium]